MIYVILYTEGSEWNVIIIIFPDDTLLSLHEEVVAKGSLPEILVHRADEITSIPKGVFRNNSLLHKR